jgi:hypothetical protein
MLSRGETHPLFVDRTIMSSTPRSSAQGFPATKTQVIAHSHIPSSQGLGGVSVIPHDCEAFARAILRPTA